MHRILTIAAICTFASLLGCPRKADDGIAWQPQAMEHDGMSISLGTRETSGAEIEPVVKITRPDGSPVANALVFCGFGQSVTQEQATIYGISPISGEGHYAGAFLKPPGDTENNIQIRIVFADGKSWTGEMPLGSQ